MKRIKKSAKTIILFEPQEKERLVNAAHTSGLTLSDFIRLHLKSVRGMTIVATSQ